MCNDTSAMDRNARGVDALFTNTHTTHTPTTMHQRVGGAHKGEGGAEETVRTFECVAIAPASAAGGG